MGLFRSKKWDDEASTGPVARCPNGGIVAVWGSPGSGKTVISVKLAEYLTAKGNNVLLILSDMEAPALPYITYEDDIKIERSMSSIFCAVDVTSDLIKRNCIITARNNYLAIVGMNRSENTFGCPKIEEELAEQFIESSKNVTPFVIVDCCSYHLGNRITSAALKRAGAIVRVCTCNRKSLGYFDSQKAYFRGEEWSFDNHILVGNALKSNQSYESIESLLGPMSVKIPYSEEVERQFLEGDLLGRLRANESREFRKSISKLSQEVFGI